MHRVLYQRIIGILSLYAIFIFSLFRFNPLELNIVKSGLNLSYAYKLETPNKSSISLNSASKKELQLLPGIGPALAERIIQYRNKHKHFNSIDELINVKGIGYKTLQKIKPYLLLD